LEKGQGEITKSSKKRLNGSPKKRARPLKIAKKKGQENQLILRWATSNQWGDIGRGKAGCRKGPVIDEVRKERGKGGRKPLVKGFFGLLFSSGKNKRDGENRW